jgi:hypothetical protein
VEMEMEKEWLGEMEVAREREKVGMMVDRV